MTFETLVRPFSDPRSLGTQRIPIIVQQVPDQDAVLTWGDAGTIIQPQEVVASDTGSAGLSSTGGGVESGAAQGGGGEGFQIQSCNTKSQEQKRATVTQRVTNPNDSSQFVDVQIPQQITFQLKKQSDILPSGFGGPTTTFGDNDELYSLIESIVDPPETQDTCQQAFAFKQ